MSSIQLNEPLKFNNTITLTLRDKNNDIVDKRIQKNLVTTVGLRLVLDILGCHGETGLTYCAVGTGNTAAVVGDTTLETELDRSTSVYTRSQSVGTYSVFFNTGEANGVITEIGFFGNDATSSADSGTMFNRIVLSNSITKITDYTLTIDLDIVIS